MGGGEEDYWIYLKQDVVLGGPHWTDRQADRQADVAVWDDKYFKVHFMIDILMEAPEPLSHKI